MAIVGSSDAPSEEIRAILTRAKTIMANPQSPKLSEADTRANFIDPLVRALGYEDLSDVVREYYVKNSQEFIDYVLRVGGTLTLAIEAKALQSELTDKAASQLVSYCAVDGIPWGVLTNGRALRLYNTSIGGGLEHKLAATIDLLAFNTDAEFASVVNQVWLLAKDNMSEPGRLADWVTKRRMDRAIRADLRNPESETVAMLRRALKRSGINVGRQDIADWAAIALAEPTVALIPVHAAGDQDPPAAKGRTAVAGSSSAGGESSVPKPIVGNRMTAWVELVAAGSIELPAILHAEFRGQVIEATVDPDGTITCNGTRAANPTAAGRVATGQYVDGWTFWTLQGEPLNSLRQRIRGRIQGTAG